MKSELFIFFKNDVHKLKSWRQYGAVVAHDGAPSAIAAANILE